MTSRTFRLTGPINLHVRIGGGSVSVTARDDASEAAVTVTPRRTGDNTSGSAADQIGIELEGNTLSVLASRQRSMPNVLAGWWRDRDGVDVQIAVPSGTAMRIATLTADVTVMGRAGDVDITTGAAAINVDEVDGDLRMRYGSANGHVRKVRGSAVLRSGAGTTRFDEVCGQLHSHSGSGELDAETVRGPAHVRTGAGSTRLGCVHANVDVAAGSGDVSIGLPAGTSARLDVRTGAGRFTSDLPVDKDRTGSGSAISIRARTGSGDIRLFHRA